jgi:hypothetical protein
MDPRASLILETDVTIILRACAASLALAALLPAQIGGNGSDGPFIPFFPEVLLDTTRNGGVFQFSQVLIQQAVTVRILGPNPAVILCTGPVDVRGSVSVSAGNNGGPPGPGGHPGGVTGSPGQPGFGPGGGAAGALPGLGVPGAHATQGSGTSATYGAALPFDLQGGSGGGGGSFVNANDQGPDGAGGGGVLVVLADGPITVLPTGSLQARGGNVVATTLTPRLATGGPGAGGSILLRSLQCVAVSGGIDASGGFGPGGARGGDGYVRIDSWSACGAPNLAGAQLSGQATALALPFLTQLEAPRPGQLWRVRCVSVPGDLLGLCVSLGTASIALPGLGTVEIDPNPAAGFAFLGLFAVPAIGIDPWAAFDLRVPANPALVGLTVHAQAANLFRTTVAQPRLSNRLDATVQ